MDEYTIDELRELASNPGLDDESYDTLILEIEWRQRWLALLEV